MIERSLAEPDRFAMVFDRYYDRILGYLGRRIDLSLAEDLASEVFLIAFRKRAGYDLEHRDAGPWLFGIATIQRSPIPRGSGTAQKVLLTLSGIATQPNVPPRPRIAVFGLLARQASVSVVRDAVDPAGRHGIGIAMRFSGGYAETDVFDSGHVVSPAGTAGLALMDSGFVHALNERP